MRTRFAAAAAAALALGAVLAVPAFALTYQTNVTETNAACTFGRASVSHRNTMILFHFINTGSVPHGLIVWGVHSTMAPPKEEANLYVKFPGPGRYPYACAAGAYSHPSIIARGIFEIRGSGQLRVIPLHGRAYTLTA
jgi:plastocyanin